MIIREIRLSSDMTQQQFSDFLHIPKRTIEDWENGRRQPPEYIIELIAFRMSAYNKERTD